MKHVPMIGRLITLEERRQIREHHAEQRRRELEGDLPIKILELRNTEFVQQQMERNGVIPLTEQEMMTMELSALWEPLQMIRNAQGWGRH